MQESLSTKHRRELLRDALEQLLNRCAIAYKDPISADSLRSQSLSRTDERSSHLQATRWDVTHRCLHVVRNPFHEV